MTPQLISYAILVIASTAVLMVGYPLLPKLWGMLPTKSADNRRPLFDAWCEMRDKVSAIQDESHRKQLIDSLNNLLPVIGEPL